MIRRLRKLDRGAAIVWTLLLINFAVLFVYREPLWLRAMNERHYVRWENPPEQVWVLWAPRWNKERGPQGDMSSYYIENGFKSGQGRWSTLDNKLVDTTDWFATGKLRSQTQEGVEGAKNEAPWWWGAEPQTEPTAPWVRQGVSVDEWWDGLPAGRKKVQQ